MDGNRKIQLQIIANEVAGDILIMEHFNEETRKSIDRFFETLPDMEISGSPLSKEETARLCIFTFLKPAIDSLVEKWTTVPEAAE